VIVAHEGTLPVAATGPDGLPVTLEMQVPTSFVDYNGHMNEAPYLEVGARASDRLMEMIGADAEYIAVRLSYFTAENHIRYLAEIDIGDRITVTTQALGGDGRKLHLLHRLLDRGRGARRNGRDADVACGPVDPAGGGARGCRGRACGIHGFAAHADHERPDRLVLNQPRA
jgi:acyl-CoA thioesterase FadM